MVNGTNGNNVYDPADTNPLSPWIKPGFSALAGIVALWLIVVSALAAIAAGNWTLVGGLIGILLIYVGWYYGQRNQDKAVSIAQSAFMSGFQTGLPITPPAPSPQNGGQIGQVTQVIPPPQVIPQPQPQPPPQPVVQPEIFDEQKFDAELIAVTRPQYGVLNEATKFYGAWNRGAVKLSYMPAARFSSSDPAWVAYLRKLVNRYFSFEWGLKDDAGNLLESGALEYAISHINDDKGCTTCGGNEMAKCPWTSIHEKADYMGSPAGAYAQALQWVYRVELYAQGVSFID